MDAAREAFEACISLGDSGGECGLSLAIIEHESGEADATSDRLSKLLEEFPRYTAAFNYAAWGEIERNNYGNATEHYRQVVATNPEDSLALNNLAYILATQGGNLDEALKYAQRAKEITPGLYDADDTLGWIYYLRGAYARALAHLRVAADEMPSKAEVFYHLSMAEAQSGNAEASRVAFERGQEIDPNLHWADEARRVLAQP